MNVLIYSNNTYTRKSHKRLHTLVNLWHHRAGEELYDTSVHAAYEASEMLVPSESSQTADVEHQMAELEPDPDSDHTGVHR